MKNNRLVRKHVDRKNAFLMLAGGITAVSLFTYTLWGRGLEAATTHVTASNAYTLLKWPTTTNGTDRFEWEITPRTDPTPDGYFWAHQFLFKTNQVGYFGIQTVSTNPAGKVAVFSVWNALAAQSPQYSSSFTELGVGYTARISFNWKANKKYHFRLARINEVATGTVTKVIKNSAGTVVSWSNWSNFPIISKGQAVYIGGARYLVTTLSDGGLIILPAGTFGGIKVGEQVVFSQLDIAGESAPYTGVPDGVWWGAWVWEDGTAKPQFVGQIKVPLSWGGLDSTSIYWTERYGGSTDNCNQIKYSLADFTGFTSILNGKPAAPSSHQNFIASDGCGNSSVTDIPGGTQQRVGNIPTTTTVTVI